MKKGVIFGAGSIGRGLLGQIFIQSGLEVVFVDIDRRVVDLINQRRSYTITTVFNEIEDTIVLSGVKALLSTDEKGLAEALREADVVATAVGAGNLIHISPMIAQGLRERFAGGNDVPVDILLCENLMHAPDIFRSYVDGHKLLTRDQLDRVGFVDTSVGRMVPLATEESKQNDPLHVYTEPYCKLQVDRNALKGATEQLIGVEAFAPFNFYKKRKLFVHNLGHSVASYWGALYGLEYIWQCMENDEIFGHTREAMLASARALAQRYTVEDAALSDYVSDLLERFYNKPLLDTVARGCRSPLRKLTPDDRFIGAVRSCTDETIACDSLLKSVAVALLYRGAQDAEACAMAEMIGQLGVEGFLEHHCGLLPEEAKQCSLYYKGLQDLEFDMTSAL